MKTRLLLLSCLIVLAFQSCMFQSADVIANKDIDVKLRETINAKNDSLITAMIHGKLKIFKALGSDHFVKHLQSNVRNTAWAFRNGYLKNKYTIFDEYQCNHSVIHNDIALTSKEHGYTFRFVNEKEDSYVSLLTIPYSKEDYLLAVIYGKEGNIWKVNEIKINIIGNYGKTAQDYYTLAKKKEEEGFLVDAEMYANVANKFIEAIGKFIEFDDAKSMPLYANRLTHKLQKKYTFPKTLENIVTKPILEGISSVAGSHGIVTQISYQTRLPVTDTEGRKQEYEEVKKEMRKEFKDLDFNKYETVYRVYTKDEVKANGSYAPRRNFYDLQDINYDYYKNVN